MSARYELFLILYLHRGKNLKQQVSMITTGHICFPGLPLNECRFAMFTSSGLKYSLDFLK